MTSTHHPAKSGGRAYDLRAVVSHRYGFVYVPVPKCGTTTMDRVLHVIHGIEDSDYRIDTDHAVRYTPDRKSGRDIETLYVPVNYVRRFKRQFEGYTWISVVRNPYDRLVSMYNYDVRRYAKHFDRKTYLFAGFFKRAAFVLGRDPRSTQRNAIRRRIGFDRFVHGLERSGTDFDIHFMRQTDIMFYDLLCGRSTDRCRAAVYRTTALAERAWGTGRLRRTPRTIPALKSVATFRCPLRRDDARGGLPALSTGLRGPHAVDILSPRRIGRHSIVERAIPAAPARADQCGAAKRCA
ncbi:sulfotransferase family 2 domain-containing protein [Mesorhizobium sp. J428]|uniref:sulfotransferase family 2 domain-containing protein n=1 Tax=Mesorhizobium sp. J428 TaxID=2898440 RepID=UPI0035B372BF